MNAVRSVIDSWGFSGVWGAMAAASLVALSVDLVRNNRGLGSMMKLVWLLTCAYSGLLGLAIYFFSGRRQIRRDSLWRRGFRSTAHCYAGCGLGEILGVSLSAGLFAAGRVWTAVATFALAYSFGLALNIGPLMQDGAPFRRALKHSLVAESASIIVMETVAIGIDLWLAKDATIGEPLFWGGMVVSLTAGLAVAYPVNVWLIERGVKEGMMNPREAYAD